MSLTTMQRDTILVQPLDVDTCQYMVSLSRFTILYTREHSIGVFVDYPRKMTSLNAGIV